jgi:N-acetylmuramoyl-L-alanine amidase
MLPFAAAAVALFGQAAQATTSGAARRDVHTIVVHAVSGPSCSGGRVVYSGAPGDAAKWKRFFDNHPFLGIHYVVDRNGTALPSTPEDREANHAANNKSGTIGIELVHQGDGVEPFGEPQFRALVNLIKGLRARHNVRIENIKGHGDVDGRTFSCGGQTVKGRSDPGANFPWARLRDALQDRPAPTDAVVASLVPRLVRGPALAVRPPRSMEDLLARVKLLKD